MDAAGDGIELIWRGKSLPAVTGCPALLRFDTKNYGTEKTTNSGWENRLILGDCLIAAAALLPEMAGSIDLLYIDPPFATGDNFSLGNRTPLSGRSEKRRKNAFSDVSRGAAYLQMMYERLHVIRPLLSPSASVYVHLDWRMNSHLRLMLDEIFGPQSFQREIIWRIGWVSGYKSKARNWVRNHDSLLFYTLDPRKFTFNKRYLPYRDGYRRRDGSLPTGPGWPLEDTWNCSDADRLDSIQIKSLSAEKSGYPTQKNEELLARIIEASSNPGDLVADFFCGSGTTLAAAEKLGRRWIGCDVGEDAVRISVERLRDLSASPSLTGSGKYGHQARGFSLFRAEL